MTDFFQAAAQLILTLEGVYSDDSNDPGGETKWGIARAAHPEIPDATWASFTRDDALTIYRAQYWDAHRCGAMPWAWALAIFDGSVNQGSVIALAQNTLGVHIDGKIGPETLDAMAVDATGGATERLDMFFAGRAVSYVALKDFPKYGRGWFKRLFAVRAACAAQPQPTEPSV